MFKKNNDLLEIERLGHFTKYVFFSSCTSSSPFSSLKANYTMVTRCWKNANELLSDEKYVATLTMGIKYVPRHIAFLYCGQKLLVVSANKNNKHAEENVIEKYRTMKDLSTNKPYRLFVLKLNGEHKMSRPCVDCSHCILNFCPRARVYYTGYDGELNEDVHLDNKHRSLRRTGRRPLSTAGLNNLCQTCN